MLGTTCGIRSRIRLTSRKFSPRWTLRAAYLAALTGEQAKGMKDLDDVRIAGEAFALCGAYLVAATDAVRSRKQT